MAALQLQLHMQQHCRFVVLASTMLTLPATFVPCCADGLPITSYLLPLDSMNHHGGALCRNRRAQKRFREKQKARQLERRDTVVELREKLDALSDEKSALASRNAILEKVFSMRARVDASVRAAPCLAGAKPLGKHCHALGFLLQLNVTPE